MDIYWQKDSTTLDRKSLQIDEFNARNDLRYWLTEAIDRFTEALIILVKNPFKVRINSMAWQVR